MASTLTTFMLLLITILILLQYHTLIKSNQPEPKATTPIIICEECEQNPQNLYDKPTGKFTPTKLSYTILTPNTGIIPKIPKLRTKTNNDFPNTETNRKFQNLCTKPKKHFLNTETNRKSQKLYTKINDDFPNTETNQKSQKLYTKPNEEFPNTETNQNFQKLFTKALSQHYFPPNKLTHNKLKLDSHKRTTNILLQNIQKLLYFTTQPTRLASLPGGSPLVTRDHGIYPYPRLRGSIPTRTIPALVTATKLHPRELDYH